MSDPVADATNLAEERKKRAKGKRMPVSGEPEWRDTNQYGVPKTTLYNTYLAIASLGIRCRHNTFSDQIMLRIEGDVPDDLRLAVGEVDDAVIGCLMRCLTNRFAFEPRSNTVIVAVETLAREDSFDPVCGMLAEAEAAWDGVARLDRMAVDHFNSLDTPLNRAFGRKTMIGAVHRARHPGCQFDTMVVMEGLEGINKSSAWRVLAGDDYFSDERVIGKDSREVQEQLGGVWIHESADLSGMRKAEVEQVKAQLSRRWDKARAAYAWKPKRRPRRSIHVGTTNNDGYLKSQTGNRRFWPLPVLKMIDLDQLRRDRLQLWGEAAHYELAGESAVLPEELWGAAAEEQEARRTTDAWETILSNIPEVVTPPGFDAGGMPFDPVTIRHIRDGREWVLGADILQYVLNPNMSAGRLQERDDGRLATVMKQIGWEREPRPMRINGKRGRGFSRPVPPPEEDEGTGDGTTEARRPDMSRFVESQRRAPRPVQRRYDGEEPTGG